MEKKKKGFKQCSEVAVLSFGAGNSVLDTQRPRRMAVTRPWQGATRRLGIERSAVTALNTSNDTVEPGTAN